VSVLSRDGLKTVPYKTVPYKTVPYKTVPYKTVPYRCSRKSNRDPLGYSTGACPFLNKRKSA